MRRSTYKSVLELAWTKYAGTIADGVPAEESSTLNHFINARLREYWGDVWWPEWTATERRYFVRDYSASTTYYRGDQVEYNDVLYHLIIPTVKGVLPTDLTAWAESEDEYAADEFQCGTVYAVGDQVYLPASDEFYQCIAPNFVDPEYITPVDASRGLIYWGRLTPLNRVIPYTSPFRSDLGELFGIYLSNPDQNRYPDSVGFTLTDKGILVWTDENDVWIKFRRRVPELAGDPFESGEVVAYNTIRYSTSQGDFYQYTPPYNCSGAAVDFTTESGVILAFEEGTAVTVSAGGYDTVLNGYWTRLDFPWILRDAVAHGAYADFLKADGQQDKFRVEDAVSRRYRDRAIYQLNVQQAQSRPLPMPAPNRLVA